MMIIMSKKNYADRDLKFETLQLHGQYLYIRHHLLYLEIQSMQQQDLHYRMQVISTAD